VLWVGRERITDCLQLQCSSQLDLCPWIGRGVQRAERGGGSASFFLRKAQFFPNPSAAKTVPMLPMGPGFWRESHCCDTISLTVLNIVFRFVQNKSIESNDTGRWKRIPESGRGGTLLSPITTEPLVGSLCHFVGRETATFSKARNYKEMSVIFYFFKKYICPILSKKYWLLEFRTVPQ